MKDWKIEIIWKDSIVISDWLPIEKIKTIAPPECRTVGYFVDENKKEIIISSSVSNSTGFYASTWKIPKGCIKSINILGVTSKWKGKKVLQDMEKCGLEKKQNS